MRSNFSPIFIVGSERSGTTLLSALIDRHSQVSIPPETFFFSDIFHQGLWPRPSLNHASLVHAAMAGRVGEFGIDPKLLLEKFESMPCTMPNLFQAILETHTSLAKKKRSGEKSVLHIFYVSLLTHWYPDAKFLGIVRDGRDVVRSMMRAPWHPNKLRIKCCNWRMKMKLVLECQKRFPDRFKMVRYEELLSNPKKILAEVDDFLDLPFEAGQTDPTIKTGVYLAREHGHKSKVEESVDPSRAFAWKQDLPPKTLWAMNSIMGPMLAKLGYDDAGLDACPLPTKAVHAVLAAFWIPAFWLLVQCKGLILYDKIRYLWRKHLRANNLHASPEGL